MSSGLTRPADAKGPYAVTRVVDGDTAKVSINGQSVTVRLIGIDTPETKHPSKPVQCFGKEASARAKALLTGRKVWPSTTPARTTATGTAAATWSTSAASRAAGNA